MDRSNQYNQLINRIRQSLRLGRPLPRIESDTDAGRQAGRHAGRRGPSPKLDDHYQNQTTTIQTTSRRTPRTIQSINQLNLTRALISARRQIKLRPPSRLAIKQAGLTACLACLIGNQASQQAEGPDLGKPASQRRACLLTYLPA